MMIMTNWERYVTSQRNQRKGGRECAVKLCIQAVLTLSKAKRRHCPWV